MIALYIINHRIAILRLVTMPICPAIDPVGSENMIQIQKLPTSRTNTTFIRFRKFCYFA